MSDLSVVSVNENEYRALASGAALQLRPQYGILLLGERDRADFLQRMTTNDNRSPPTRPGRVDCSHQPGGAHRCRLLRPLPARMISCF